MAWSILFKDNVELRSQGLAFGKVHNWLRNATWVCIFWKKLLFDNV
jgi:hypothetical protein